ncbi:MAG: PorV/PorQ family protein [Elusimicrobia bacterium]|nr:PorV/PorQ family protein [Elusimicrobiota bacterium]
MKHTRANWGPFPSTETLRIAAIGAAMWSFVVLLAPRTSMAGETGGQPGAFMQYGVGARALGMGGAFYSIADDASAAYWNPAGLPQVKRQEITTMQASLFAQTSLTYLAYVRPAGSGTWGLSILQLQSAGFEKVDAKFDNAGNAIEVKPSGSFNDAQRAIGISWGKAVTDKLAFGANVKQVTRQLAGSSDSQLAMDVSMMRTFSPLYRMGIGIQNAFSKRGGDTDDKMPVTLKVGNSLHLFKDRLVFGADISKSQTSDPNFRFGGEFWASRWFALRFGLMGNPTIQETDFGFGFHFRSLSIDIANGIHDLGASTRISASFRFGRSREEKSDEQTKVLIQSGFEAFKEGNFALASVRFQQALDADPANAQIKAMIARLQAVVSLIPQAQGGEEFQTYVRKGVMSYVDGRDLRVAVNSLRYAYNKNSKNEKLLNLLNQVEREAGVGELTRRIDGPEMLTMIDQKIYDARQSIYEGKYDQAIRRAQDVLDLEPANIVALEIMGSAFFLMEEKAKAKAVWKRVMEIDPNNKVVSEFMSQIK